MKTGSTTWHGVTWGCPEEQIFSEYGVFCRWTEYMLIFYTNTHRLTEIEERFVPRTARCDRAKRTKRDNMSFVIRVREIVLFLGQPTPLSYSFNISRSSKIGHLFARVIISNVPSIFISICL